MFTEIYYIFFISGTFRYIFTSKLLYCIPMEIVTNIYEEHDSYNREIAGELYNLSWTLLDKKARTEEEDEAMLNAAHASVYHWRALGSDSSLAAGYLLLSRIYTHKKCYDLALDYAEKCLDICEQKDISENEFDINWAYGAVASAHQNRAEFYKRKYRN